MPPYSAAGEQALNQLGNLPFDNIIGGPLNAAINAQAQAAETTVDFIQSVGMHDVGGQKQAINVQFAYQDNAGVTRRITVPILAIVPIPFIVIDEIAISFKAKITASTVANSSQSQSSGGFGQVGVGYRGTRLRASLLAGYSAKKDSRASQESKYAVEYTMDVSVKASQAGLPQGMEAVLGFLQQGTHAVPLRLQAQTIGFSSTRSVASTAIGSFAMEFDLVVTDEVNQPVIDLETSGIVVTSSNGYFTSSAITDNTSTDDGVYDITLGIDSDKVGSVADGQTIEDQVLITVTSGTDTIVLERPFAVTVSS